MTKLKIVILSAAAAALAAFGFAPIGPAVAAPAAPVTNVARALQLQDRQEAVVLSTHYVIEARLGALKGVVNGANEKAAVEAVRSALHGQAMFVDVVTQGTMTELLQMLRVPVTQRLRAQHVANEARAVQLQARQEAVVLSTHEVVQARLSALKRVVSGANEKAAVEAVRAALHAHAKVVHVATQRTMTELLQMLRRSLNQLTR
jgi:hypothetical protein